MDCNMSNNLRALSARIKVAVDNALERAGEEARSGTAGETSLLQGFEEGLCVLGVLDAIRTQPSMKAAFVLCGEAKELTGAAIAEMFTCKWSPTASTRYQAETRTMAWWGEFLEDMEDEGLLKDVLIFCSGADEIPPLGFDPEPRIIFGHLDDLPLDCETKEFPYANTCVLQLRLPIHDDYSTFKCRMAAAIQRVITFTDA